MFDHNKGLFQGRSVVWALDVLKEEYYSGIKHGDTAGDIHMI